MYTMKQARKRYRSIYANNPIAMGFRKWVRIDYAHSSAPDCSPKLARILGGV